MVGESILNLKVSTIKRFINEYNTDEFTIDKCFLKEILIKDDGGKIIINDMEIFDEYLEELSSKCRYIQMDDAKLNYFKYNPKLFSYEIYGTTELWFLILQLNEMHTCAEFDRNTLKLFPTSIVDIILDIFELEKNSINQNSYEIANEINKV